MYHRKVTSNIDRVFRLKINHIQYCAIEIGFVIHYHTQICRFFEKKLNYFQKTCINITFSFGKSVLRLIGIKM